MHANRSGTGAAVALAICVAISALAACGSSKQDNARHPAAAAHRPGLTGVIVYRRFFDSGHHSGAIFTINAGGGSARQVSHPPIGAVDSLNGPPGFTPDGSTFTFDRTDANGTGSLWSVRADGSHEHRLRSLAGMPGDGWPAVSPDGRQIAVARAWGKPDRYQDIETGLYVLRSDGSMARLVAAFGYRADVGGATWSPDGRQLVFGVHNNGPGRPANASALFAVSAKGGTVRRITPWDTSGQISCPTFSPDGKHVLFQIKPAGEDLGGNYFTIQPDGAGRRQLTKFPAGSNLGSARFSPDGKRIVFANNGIGGNDDLFVMRADGTNISPLTRTATWESAATWIP